MIINKLHKELVALYQSLRNSMKEKFERRVSLADLFTDRWETAEYMGFGEGTSCYDNVLILGDVKVGKRTWIGPNTILDGSGGLEIGDHCTISAGAQIYSHNNVQQTVSMGERPIERKPVTIGSGVYIGPQTVIQMGVTIGDRAIIGACSFVNKDVAADTKVAGTPARVL